MDFGQILCIKAYYNTVFYINTIWQRLCVFKYHANISLICLIRFYIHLHGLWNYTKFVGEKGSSFVNHSTFSDFIVKEKNARSGLWERFFSVFRHNSTAIQTCSRINSSGESKKRQFETFLNNVELNIRSPLCELEAVDWHHVQLSVNQCKDTFCE